MEQRRSCIALNLHLVGSWVRIIAQVIGEASRDPQGTSKNSMVIVLCFRRIFEIRLTMNTMFDLNRSAEKWFKLQYSYWIINIRGKFVDLCRGNDVDISVIQRSFAKCNKYEVQVVYLTFERLWNLARETFAPIWILSKVIYIQKFSCKIITKDLIWKYSETATSWVFDQTWWRLASQVRPNVPFTNLSLIPPSFISILNFIFSPCMEWNGMAL